MLKTNARRGQSKFFFFFCLTYKNVTKTKQPMETKINALKKKVQNLINTSEYRGVKVLGVKCSRADLEQIVFISDILLQQGNLRGYVVYGETKQVFEKAGIELKN